MTAFIEDAQGTAMTEGVIVVPFFIVVWMALIAIHHLYAGRLDAQSASLSEAIDRSRRGACGEADKDLGDFEQTAGTDTGVDAKTSDLLSSIAGCQPFAWSHAYVSSTKRVGNIPTPLGGPERNVRGQAVVMCNMKPVDGLIDLVAQNVKKLLGIGS